MQITTIGGEKIDTDKLSDMGAEMIELVEKSGLRDFAIKHNGACYSMLAIPGQKVWTNLHLPNKVSVDCLLDSINHLMLNLTDNKYRILVVPVEEQENFK